MLDGPPLTGWLAVPPNIYAPWWFPAISFRPCMCLNFLGLASSETECLAATTLQSSADECGLGEVAQFRYCFCMQSAAASPKTVVASSAAPKYSEKTTIIMMMTAT